MYRTSWNGAFDSEVAFLCCRCDVCPFVALSRDALSSHKKHHSWAPSIKAGESRTKCPYCPYFAQTPMQMESHLALHEEDPPTVTSPANTPLKTDAVSNKGRSGSKKTPKMDDKLWFVCTLCPFKTEHIADYKQHHTHHKPSREWTLDCDQCPYHTADLEDLEDHTALHTQELEDAENGDEAVESEDEGAEEAGNNKKVERPNHHKCNLCPFAGKPNKLRKHQTLHEESDERQVKCPHCPFYVEKPHFLSRHLLLHVAAKAAKEKTGAEASVQQEAVESSDEEAEESITINQGKAGFRKTKYQCPHCPFLGRKGDMEGHFQAHKPNPKNTYECGMCTFACSSKFALPSHLKVHQPDYIAHQATMYKLQLDPNQTPSDLAALATAQAAAPSSPTRSDISDVSDCDAVEMASIKQQLMTAKLVGVSVAASRFKTRVAEETDNACHIEGNTPIEMHHVQPDYCISVNTFRS